MPETGQMDDVKPGLYHPGPWKRREDVATVAPTEAPPADDGEDEAEGEPEDAE